MLYNQETLLTKNRGNNALSYEKRGEILGKNPSLTIPKIISGTIDDVQTGEKIVFEEIDETGKLQSCKGLKNFVRIDKKGLPPIIVFDNHNHALFFWYEALHNGLLQSPFELIHIDEHSDLWDNSNDIDHKKAVQNLEYAWEFTNYQCNVGNYIQPLLRNDTIKNMIRIENEYQIDEHMNYSPSKSSILNLDLDIFTPELDHISGQKKINCITHFFSKVKLITIATSPYFISPGIALQKLSQILSDFHE